MNYHTIKQSPEMLAAIGYKDGAQLHTVKIDNCGLTVSAPSKATFDPRGTCYTWSPSEFLHSGCRCPRESLFVPGVSGYNARKPINFSPSIYIYSTPELLDQAIQWARLAIVSACEDDVRALQVEIGKRLDKIASIAD